MKEYGNFGKEELAQARKRLEEMKDEKLRKHAEKHLNDPLNFWAIVEHLRQEHNEFRAVAGTPADVPEYDQQLIELADISNCCDILAMVLMDKKQYKVALPTLEELFSSSE
jgi:hypothetical protein